MTDARLADLLEKTSRTFALSIPMLPAPTDRDVTIAYLLFRIADTFEDAVHWSIERSTKALADLAGMLSDTTAREDEGRLVAGWLDDPPPDDNPSYVELLAETPLVLDAYRSMDAEAREILGRHLQRTIVGMAGFVRQGRPTGMLRLDSVEALQEYCYYVAGIVGEMLTDLYVVRHPDLRPVAHELRRRAAVFGEALQLVNILKDSAKDVEEGRSFLPSEANRPRVMTLARRNLDVASEYTRLLQESGAPRGVVASNALPILLARATLERVEAAGPGAKIARELVFTAIEGMNDALDTGRPVV